MANGLMAVLMVGTLLGGGTAVGVTAMNGNMMHEAGDADMGNGNMNHMNNAWEYMWQNNDSGECMEYQWQHNYSQECQEHQEHQWEHQHSNDEVGEQDRDREQRHGCGMGS